MTPDGATLVDRVDALARELRVSATPRRDLADALDWYIGEWAPAGYPAPCLAVLDHLRTLAEAAVEAERALERGGRPGPVEPAWDPTPTDVKEAR
jgi:hypothetical protein